MPVLKPGTRLRSTVCASEVMVIQAPGAEVEITCGGAPMVALGSSSAGASGATRPPGVSPQAAEGGAQRAAGERSQQIGGSSATPGTLIGKRYVNAAGDLELLCTKPGAGALAVAGAPLTVKGAKPLPSSD